MQNIVVISSNTHAVETIAGTLSAKSSVKNTTSAKDALQIHKQNPFDIIFIDLEPPEIAADFNPIGQAIRPFKKINPMVQFIVIAPKAGLPKTFFSVREDAAGLMIHPVKTEELSQVFEHVQATLTREMELDYLRDQFWKKDWLEVIQSRNSIMKKVYEAIRSVAPTVASVLLFGETGTGKGLLARLIHWHSNRYKQPFIVVHCGAIPDTLIESELFGHEKGAFTGADRRKYGKFEMAHGGTIFLDEIGTISPLAQIKLLQVLQDGTFSRVGGTAQLNTDARVITASNSDLEQLADQGLFRKDLYYRLNVFPIEIPPLRDRLEDLQHFTGIFLDNLNTKYGKAITKLHPAVREGFKTYDWPGNIRELENILERAYILEKSDMLSPQNFPNEMVIAAPYMESLQDQGIQPLAKARKVATEEFESVYLRNLLKRCQGKINLSAAEAGITSRQFNRLMKRHGIRKSDFKV